MCFFDVFFSVLRAWTEIPLDDQHFFYGPIWALDVSKCSSLVILDFVCVGQVVCSLGNDTRPTRLGQKQHLSVAPQPFDGLGRQSRYY